VIDALSITLFPFLIVKNITFCENNLEVFTKDLDKIIPNGKLYTYK
jgi:hypothetical protein